MSTEPAPEFRSPKRALARSFRLSRDRWKAKAGKRRVEIRVLKVRLRDLETSRDLWKQKAAHLQAHLDLFQAPLAATQPSSSLETFEPPVPVGELHSPVATSVPTSASLPGPSALHPPSPTDEAPLEKKVPRSRCRHASS